MSLCHVFIGVSLCHVLSGMFLCHMLNDMSLHHVLIDMSLCHVLTLMCQHWTERNRFDDVCVVTEYPADWSQFGRCLRLRVITAGGI